MQLKIQRSQRQGGVMSKSVIFCLDARVQFTAEEQANINRYKLAKQVIYNSEASKKHLARGDASTDGSTTGHLKALASFALAAMNLNISIDSLQRGQHVECKSLDELLGAEQAVITACENLKGYLDAAATFDGREVLIDFDTGTPEVIASAPAPMLVAPSPALHRTAEISPPLSQTPSGGAAAIASPSVYAEAHPDESWHELGRDVRGMWDELTPNVKAGVQFGGVVLTLLVLYQMFF